MISKEKQEILDKIEYRLSLLRDQEELYQTFRDFIKHYPNNMELGEAIRLLFTSNIK